MNFCTQLLQFKGFIQYPTLKLFDRRSRKRLRKGKNLKIERTLPRLILNSIRELSTRTTPVTKAIRELAKIEIRKNGLEVIF
jgi:hypothetical protein